VTQVGDLYGGILRLRCDIAMHRELCLVSVTSDDLVFTISACTGMLCFQNIR